MIDCKAYLDDFEIIHSGQVHTSLEKTVKIEFADMKFVIEFTNDSKLSSNINWAINSGVLKIVFENYISPLGSGILEPWYVGIHNDRKFYITIYLKSIDHGPKKFIILDYIFYLREEADNG